MRSPFFIPRCIYQKNSILLFLFGILLTVFSCQPKSSSPVNSSESTSQKIQKVGIVFPQLRDFTSDVKVIGTATSNQMVKLQAMENGVIRSMTKDIGDHVKKGEVLAILSNPPLKSKYREAKSRAESLEASIQKHQAEKRNWKAQVKAKKSIYERINSTYKKASNIVLASDRDRAEADYLSAEAQFSSATSAITMATADYQAAQALVQAYSQRVGMLRIKAPFKGIITKRYMDVGATVQSGLEENDALPLFNLQDNETIRLVLDLPESDAATLVVGSAITALFPELPGQELNAKISRTSGSLDEISNTMRVEIDIENTSGRLKPGMYAEVRLKAKNRQGVLSLPTETKKLINDVPYVLLVENNIITLFPLRQGLVSRDYFEILNEDISATSKVVIQGKNLVKAGQEVAASPLNN